MKLKFSIQYGTQWGESLHVVLCYGSADGTERTANLLMNTDDGLMWTVETAVVHSQCSLWPSSVATPIICVSPRLSAIAWTAA